MALYPLLSPIPTCAPPRHSPMIAIGFVSMSCRVKLLSPCYRPQRSWGKVMFLQVCVILFTGGEYLTRYPPGPGTPPKDQVHPLTRYIPQTRYTPWTRYTPLPRPGTPPRDQVNPPWDQVHPPRDQVHPLDQVHPPTRYTPRDQEDSPRPSAPPGPGTPPRDQGDTIYAWAVRILLECILVVTFIL